MTRVSSKNCARILPIYLSSFKGNSAPGFNELQLTFENESDLKVCILERTEHRPDDNQWTPITQFSNTASTVKSYNYSFKDYTAYPLTYYRLKSIDTRGEVFYSEIISIKNSSVHDELLVYPIPANQYLRFKGKIPSEISSISILNAGGVTIKKINYVPGSFPSTAGILDIKELSSGVYYLVLKRCTRNQHCSK